MLLTDDMAPWSAISIADPEAIPIIHSHTGGWTKRYVLYHPGIGFSLIGLMLAAQEKGQPQRNDLLARLMEGKDEDGNKLGQEELTAEALTQLVAGSDTTSNTSCALLYWCTKTPRNHGTAPGGNQRSCSKLRLYQKSTLKSSAFGILIHSFARSYVSLVSTRSSTKPSASTPPPPSAFPASDPVGPA